MNWFVEHVTLDVPRWALLAALVWGVASAAVWWFWRDAVSNWRKTEFLLRAARRALSQRDAAEVRKR